MDTVMVTDTTIQGTSKRHPLFTLSALTTALMTLPVFAAQHQFEAAVATEISFIDRQYEDSEDADAWQYQFNPSITYLLDGNHTDVALNISHTWLGSDDSDLIASRDFTDFSAKLESRPVDWFRFDARAERRFRATNPLDGQYGRSFLQRDGLSRVDSLRTSAELLLNNSEVNGTLGIDYSNIDAEEVEGQAAFRALDSEVITARASLASAQRQRLIWGIDISASEAEREQYTDYTSERVNAALSVPAFDNWYVRVQASHEDYEIEEASLSLGGNRFLNQTSYGAGVEWRRSPQKYIAVTYNNAERDTLDEDEQFVALDMAWTLSERTSMEASYGKRFYGTAKALKIEHANRSVTTSIYHKEDISTYNQLDVERDFAVYVCPVNADGLFDCARTEAGYDPLPGEFLVNTVEVLPELTEEVRFIKETAANVAWQVGVKLTLGAGVSLRETDYLESNRFGETDSYSVFADYKMSRNSKMNATLGYVDATGNGFTIAGESKTFALSYDSKLSRQLTYAVSYRYTDRDSENQFYTMKENRLSLTAAYTF